jgi:hypothetical protein
MTDYATQMYKIFQTLNTSSFYLNFRFEIVC